MASKIVFKLIILIVFTSVCCLKECSSLSSEEEHGYKKWVSWNIEDYRTKIILKEESISAVPGGGRTAGLDEKLRKAEMNKVRISVGQDGRGDFNTIREALSSIPTPNSRRVILVISPGIYREKISIPRTLPFVTLLGDAAEIPTITGNDTASVTGNDGAPLGTWNSATVTVEANYFVAINVKFENTAPHEIGSRKGQAVAIRVSGTKSAFHNCSFYGSQDTLYDHKGLHYFNNCFIQGSVDFIFGYGRSLYENCYLNSIAKKVASLTAQKRSKTSMASGFSFKDSTVTGSGHVYLGRAWGDYSRVIFSYSYLDQVVLPQGWSDWGNSKRDSTVYYGEYKCSGEGANLTGRVGWALSLTDEEAQPFIGTHYIEGDTWLISP